MKRVAVLLHGLGANGIDSLFAELSLHWSERIEVYYFLAIDETENQFWEEKVRNTGVKIVKLHDLDKNRLYEWPSTLYGALKQYGPFDAVHSNMDMLNGVNMLIAKALNIPIRISHAHRGNSDNTGTVCKQFLSRLYRKIMRLLMNHLSTVKLACSDVAGDYFFGEGKYRLIINGIDLKKYAKPQIGTANPSSNEIKFITVGRIVALKNPEKIISVFREVHKRLPNTTLTWCGDGELRANIEELIEANNLENAVFMVGLTDNVAEYLKGSDYFLLPSLFEGLSIALAEAQASGLDCFVSDTCSRLSDCGKCVFIPLHSSDSEWADIICNHTKNSKLAIDEEYMSKFDIRYMTKELESYYLQTK